MRAIISPAKKYRTEQKMTTDTIFVPTGIAVASAVTVYLYNELSERKSVTAKGMLVCATALIVVNALVEARRMMSGAKPTHRAAITVLLQTLLIAVTMGKMLFL